MNALKMVSTVLMVLSVVLLFGCQSEQDTAENATGEFKIYTDLEEAKLAAAENDRHILLDFWSDT